MLNLVHIRNVLSFLFYVYLEKENLNSTHYFTHTHTHESMYECSFPTMQADLEEWSPIV